MSEEKDSLVDVVVNDNPPKHDRPEWTVREMLMFGGTGWFYIILAYYSLMNVWFVLLDMQDSLCLAPRVLVYLASLLSIIGGIGMSLGLFLRPAWRGWRWVILVGFATAGEFLYASMYWTSWREDIITFPELWDEVSWAIIMGIGFFRANIDLFVWKGRIHRCPRKPGGGLCEQCPHGLTPKVGVK